ncbi:MAG: MBL fold metallo-hydrolase [Chloroflexia bacterium]|nr:MBL fold metallo-hydrolase [Chloroflexia bacterium]
MADRDWFEVQRLPHAVTMIREPHHSEDVKSYLVEGEEDVAVIDTGTGAGDFAGLVAALTSRRPRLLQTHAHWDHIGASCRFEDVLVHRTEAEALRAGLTAERYHDVFWRDPFDNARVPSKFDTRSGIPGAEPNSWLEHGDRIDLGGRELEVFHTPGHSPGSVTFLDRRARALFSGDLLYLGAMYVFFPSSDPAAFRASLQLVASLADAFDAVYPSHGPSPLEAGHVLTIHDAFEDVWQGRLPDRLGSLYGLPIVVFDFGSFAFLLPPDRLSVAAEG